MPTVADVMRRYGGAYLERYGPAVPTEHRKVLAGDHRLPHGTVGDRALRL